jgi:hypothetical protein
MIGGFEAAKSNRRGVTTRMPRDGGALERDEAAKDRARAKAVRYEHPTAPSGSTAWPDGQKRPVLSMFLVPGPMCAMNPG